MGTRHPTLFGPRKDDLRLPETVVDEVAKPEVAGGDSGHLFFFHLAASLGDFEIGGEPYFHVNVEETRSCRQVNSLSTFTVFSTDRPPRGGCRFGWLVPRR